MAAVRWLAGTVAIPEPEEFDQDGSGSQSEVWTNERLSAQVTLIQEWDYRHSTLNNILLNGLLWPHNPASNMRAISGGIRPLKGKGTKLGHGIGYQHALIQVNFEVAYASTSNPTVLYQEELRPSGEMLSLPPEDFKWITGTPGADDKLKENEAPSRLEFGYDYIVRWHNLITIPSQVLTHINSVNNGIVNSPSLGLQFAGETLLLNPNPISRTVSYGGSNRYSMEARWSFRQNGWNQWWRARTRAYSRMYNISDSQVYNQFPLKSFTGLLP